MQPSVVTEEPFGPQVILPNERAMGLRELYF